MSPCSALCPFLLVAPPNTLQCLPFAAQMLRAVGLGCGSHSSQAPSKRSGWPVLTSVIAITSFSACNAVQEATGLLFSPGSTEAPLDLGPFDCGNFGGPRGMHRVVFLLQVCMYFHCLKRSFLNWEFICLHVHCISTWLQPFAKDISVIPLVKSVELFASKYV